MCCFVRLNLGEYPDQEFFEGWFGSVETCPVPVFPGSRLLKDLGLFVGQRFPIEINRFLFQGGLWWGRIGIVCHLGPGVSV